MKLAIWAVARVAVLSNGRFTWLKLVRLASRTVPPLLAWSREKLPRPLIPWKLARAETSSLLLGAVALQPDRPAADPCQGRQLDVSAGQGLDLGEGVVVGRLPGDRGQLGEREHAAGALSPGACRCSPVPPRSWPEPGNVSDAPPLTRRLEPSTLVSAGRLSIPPIVRACPR